MTTVLNPLGLTSIAFNRAGKNIQNILPGDGNTFGDAANISHISERTMLVIDATSCISGYGAISLDADFDLGDEVSVWWHGATALYIFNSAGVVVATLTSTVPASTFMLVDAVSQIWRPVN